MSLFSPGKLTTLAVRSVVVLPSSLAVVRPYPLISTTKWTRLWLCCIFPVFFSTIFSTVIYTVFISKGKSWSFPWMFCFVFAVFWCCDKKHQSTSLPSLLKPLRFDMYVYLFYHLFAGYLSLSGRKCGVCFSFHSAHSISLFFIDFLFTAFSGGNVSFIIEVQSVFSDFFFFTDVSPFHKIQSQFMTTNHMHKNGRFLHVICWNCKDLCKVFIGLIYWLHTVHYRS